MLTLSSDAAVSDPLEPAALPGASVAVRIVPLEADLMEQAAVAARDIADCRRLRDALRQEKIRSARRLFEHQERTKLHDCLRTFKRSCTDALMGLNTFAEGVRYQIGRWEYLDRTLRESGSWAGRDKHESINLRGLSSYVDDLYLNEEAYVHWVDTLAALPNPKQADIDIILRKDVIPKRMQDMKISVWKPEPEAARARLQAIVDEALPPLRALEAKLRVEEEEPRRAAVIELALAQPSKEELALVRLQRSHERSYDQATRALLRLRGAKDGEAAAAEPRGEPPAALVTPLATGDSRPPHPRPGFAFPVGRRAAAAD
jgi:hypothetical protein